MTLSERNTFFKIGIIFCALCTLLAAAASFLIIPDYPQMEESTPRPSYVFQFFSGRFLGNDNYAVHSSISVIVLFSLVAMILIHFFFERTSAPEILYISFFTVSFSIEVIRLVLPLYLIYNFSSAYLLVGARVLLFARFFGIFSLFAAGLCAAGLEVQNTRNVIFVTIIAVMVIVLGVPIDVQTWDTGFNMANSYNSLFKTIEAAAFLTTMISFFIASNVRESKEYVPVAIGIMFAVFGRDILLGADNWAAPFTGIFLLSFGTWYICARLHKIHLWL